MHISNLPAPPAVGLRGVHGGSPPRRTLVVLSGIRQRSPLPGLSIPPGQPRRGSPGTTGAGATSRAPGLWRGFETLMGVTWEEYVEDCGPPRGPKVSGQSLGSPPEGGHPRMPLLPRAPNHHPTQNENQDEDRVKVIGGPGGAETPRAPQPSTYFPQVTPMRPRRVAGQALSRLSAL